MHPPRSEEAIGFYRAARALRPETAHELAHVLERRGRGEEAVAVFQDLVRLRDGNGRHWGCYGQLLKERGNRAGAGAALERAVAALREAIRLKPDDGRCPLHPRPRPDAQGNLTEAIAEYREAIRLKPDDAAAHYNLGNVLRRQGSWTRRSPSYREAIRLQPDTPRPTPTSASPWQAQEKLDEAIAAFREAIRLKPDFAQAHCQPRQRPATSRASWTRPSPIPRGDPAQARPRRGPLQPRQHPADQGKLRRGHRRVPRGDPAQARLRRGPLQPRRCPARLRGRLDRGHHRIRRGAYGSSPTSPRSTTASASPCAARGS